jgi:hypothetical protein
MAVAPRALTAPGPPTTHCCTRKSVYLDLRRLEWHTSTWHIRIRPDRAAKEDLSRCRASRSSLPRWWSGRSSLWGPRSPLPLWSVVPSPHRISRLSTTAASALTRRPARQAERIVVRAGAARGVRLRRGDRVARCAAPRRPACPAIEVLSRTGSDFRRVPDGRRRRTGSSGRATIRLGKCARRYRSVSEIRVTAYRLVSMICQS